jgi:signal peptidase I
MSLYGAIKIAVAFGIAWLIIWLYSSFSITRLKGKEMEPNIDFNKFLIIHAGERGPEKLKRADIVYFTYHHEDIKQREFGARVIGLPGDTIKVKDGQLFVNGKRYIEVYLPQELQGLKDMDEILVPRDMMFVLCDNRRVTERLDSRRIGLLGKWAVQGRVSY